MKVKPFFFLLFTRFSFFVLLLLFFTVTVAVTALLRAFEQFANGVYQLIFFFQTK